MKKILFLVTQSEMGGAQRYIYEISKVLTERYEILVAAGEGDGELFRKLENTGVQPRRLKQMRRTPNPYLAISAIAEITRLLKKEKPDVLFLCSTTAGLLGSLAGFIYKLKIKNLKLKIIYRIGGWAFNDPRSFWKNWLIFGAEKLTARFKDIIIVNSECDRQIAVEKKITSPKKIMKIYNGIDADSLDFLTKEEARASLAEICTASLAVISTAKLIGCVANFYKTKGLEYLIKALYIKNASLSAPGADKLVAAPGADKLLVIGEGRERPKLEAQIRKLKLENKVILVGRIPDAYKYLKAFDLFVLPSLKEGFPWVILEAIAAGIPIIATKVGAMPEILPEECLVEPGDSDALAKKMNWMLEHPALPKLKQKFSLQKMVEETERLF